MTRTTLSLAAAVLVVAAMLAGAFAQQGPPTRADGQAPEKKSPENRQPREFAERQGNDPRARSERAPLESGDPGDDPGQCRWRGQR